MLSRIYVINKEHYMRASAFTVVAVFTLLLYAHALTLDSTHMQPGILSIT